MFCFVLPSFLFPASVWPFAVRCLPVNQSPRAYISPPCPAHDSRGSFLTLAAPAVQRQPGAKQLVLDRASGGRHPGERQVPFVRLGPASSSAHRRARAAAGVWAGVRPAAGEGIWAMGQAGGGQGGSGDQSGRTGGRGGDQGGVLQESSGAAATSAARGRSGSQWTWAWAGAGLRWRRGERHSSSGLWWRLRGTGRDGRGGGGSQALCRANPKSPAPVEGSARGRSCVSGSGRPCALSLLGEWAAVGCAREMGPNGLIGRFRHLPHKQKHISSTHPRQAARAGSTLHPPRFLPFASIVDHPDPA